MIVAAALCGSTASAVIVSPAIDDGTLSLDKLTATRDRPLFVASRRPPQVAPPAAAVETPPAAEVEPPHQVTPPNATLTGIIIGETARLAIVLVAATGKTQTLKEGDTLEDWTIATVQARQVVLENGEDRATLTLKTRDGAATAESLDESAPPRLSLPKPPSVPTAQLRPPAVHQPQPLIAPAKAPPRPIGPRQRRVKQRLKPDNAE